MPLILQELDLCKGTEMFRIVKKKKILFQLNWCQEGSEAAQCNHPDWYSLVPHSVTTAKMAGSLLKLNERLKPQAFSHFRDNVLLCSHGITIHSFMITCSFTCIQLHSCQRAFGENEIGLNK